MANDILKIMRSQTYIRSTVTIQSTPEEAIGQLNSQWTDYVDVKLPPHMHPRCSINIRQLEYFVLSYRLS